SRALLLLLILAFVVYGSLYPFEFTGSDLRHALTQFLSREGELISSRGDILQNIVLFLPYGFVSVFGLRRTWGDIAVAAGALAAGLALAVAVQVLQVYVPGRTPSMEDVASNLLGMAGGVVAGVVASWVVGPRRRFGAVPVLRTDAILLIMAFLAFELFPLVPSLDFQLIKDNLKPLLLHPQPTWLGVAVDGAAWLVVFQAISAVRPRLARWPAFVLLTAVVLAAQVVIIRASLSANDVLGAAAALLVWPLLPAERTRRTVTLFGLLLAVTVAASLEPFRLLPAPQPFRWVPFAALIESDRLSKVPTLLQKGFVYGSLVWLLLETRLRPSVAIGLVA